MLDDAIRHVAGALGSDDLFVTAEFERTVSVWSLGERRKIVTFETGLDFGGRRLGMTVQPEPIVFIGAYHVHGMCAYAANEGELVWQRKDLKRVQDVDSVPGGRVAVGFDEGRSLHLLEAASGDTLAKLPGVSKLRTSPDSSLALGAGHSGSGWVALYELPSAKRRWRQRLTSFTILDAGVGPTSVVVGEVAGPLRCFDVDGGECWRWEPPPGEHVVEVCWSPTFSGWLCVLVPYERGGSMRSVLGVDEEGEISFAFEVREATEAAFLGGDRFLITSGGQVMEALSGDVVWEFDAAPAS